MRWLVETGIAKPWWNKPWSVAAERKSAERMLSGQFRCPELAIQVSNQFKKKASPQRTRSTQEFFNSSLCSPCLRGEKTIVIRKATTKAIYTSLLRRTHHELLRRLRTKKQTRAQLRGAERAGQATGRRAAAAAGGAARAGGMGAKAGEAVVARGS